MKRLFLAFALFFFFSAVVAQVVQVGQRELVVNAGVAGIPIQPTMWGIFFEDINMAADGGLYAELVKNRSFEFNAPLMGWKEWKDHPADGSVLVINRQQENPANPRYIRLTHYSDGTYGLSNEGFRGMGIKKSELYHFSVWDRTATPMALRLELRTPDGQVIGLARLPVMAAGEWKKDTVSFAATATEPHAQLYVWVEGRGSVDLDMVSLFPQHTWKERPGGLRADLVELLADLHPGFIRFPGGCIVEGRELATRYQWKKTVGKVEDRQSIVNRWNTEFAWRPSPDYYQSFGLGFFEYFQLAEDIGAEPLPILNCGMACQFNTAEVAPVDQLDPYIRDALDLIEFANGPVSSRWGGLRAAMGHPEPFHLKMMGVGNEQWGPQYIERYTIFTRAIKARYPDIRLVNSTGPNPDGELFNFLNDTLRQLHADVLDEHYYRSPGWFLQNAGRYDSYDRGGPKIFAGEYAAQSSKVATPDNKNTWQCALAEAAFMTGLERNADIVFMASYAPLFAHVDGWQWTPDLIWFDNLRSYGTADYYVQKLFSNNKGSAVLPLTLAGKPLSGQDGWYGTAAMDQAKGELILKLVNTTGQPQSGLVRLEGVRKPAARGTVIILKAQPDQTNSLDSPTEISPVAGEIGCKDKRLNVVLEPYSFTVIRIRV